METNILMTHGSCPYCGKELPGYMENQVDYGTPIRVCKKCGNSYLDKRYHEIAVEGIVNNALSVRRDVFVAALGIVFFAVSLLVNYLSVMSTGKYSLKLVFVQILSIVLLLYALIDGIMIKTGMKEKRYEKKQMESVKRLENTEYARMLADLGYDVPDKYLNSF